jgi:hypothetical protein
MMNLLIYPGAIATRRYAFLFHERTRPVRPPTSYTALDFVRSMLTEDPEVKSLCSPHESCEPSARETFSPRRRHNIE